MGLLESLSLNNMLWYDYISIWHRATNTERDLISRKTLSLVEYQYCKQQKKIAYLLEMLFQKFYICKYFYFVWKPPSPIAYFNVNTFLPVLLSLCKVSWFHCCYIMQVLETGKKCSLQSAYNCPHPYCSVILTCCWIKLFTVSILFFLIVCMIWKCIYFSLV